MNLWEIKSPDDIKNVDLAALKDLAKQMRSAVLKRTSDIGGHVGPNLGSVESIIALYRVFDAPQDKIVFDVSHQSFAMKMLTGRVDGYLNPEDYDKVGEYTDPTESPEYDLFYAGHTSPSISLSVGLAKARDLRGEKNNVVAFIGDGSLSGGEAFEGLNTGAALGSNFIVVVNDNQMAIAETHGGIYPGLMELRESNGTSPNNIFKAFGYDYVYVAEGNDLESLIAAFEKVKDSKKPVVVHVNTQKGEGYVPAEEFKEAFHWRAPFDIATGALKHVDPTPDYSTITGQWIKKMADTTPDFLVITASTPDSFGLPKEVRDQLGDHYLDVGIAEQTAVAVASGAAKGNAHSLFCVEATFLQRAYDQLMEDLSMNQNPAVIAVFGTGVDSFVDETHLGFWDIPMISNIAGILYLAPTCVEEYYAMLEWGMKQRKRPVMIRVPMLSVEYDNRKLPTDFGNGKWDIACSGQDVAIIAVGDLFPMGKKICENLTQKGYKPTLISPVAVSSIDHDAIEKLSEDHSLVITMENGSLDGGFGQKVAAATAPMRLRTRCYGLKKEFLDHFNPAKVMKTNRLDASLITSDILSILQPGK